MSFLAQTSRVSLPRSPLPWLLLKTEEEVEVVEEETVEKESERDSQRSLRVRRMYYYRLSIKLVSRCCWKGGA